jgi:hypothetical protein
VIKKPRERGSNSPRWAAEPEKIKIIGPARCTSFQFITIGVASTCFDYLFAHHQEALYTEWPKKIYTHSKDIDE